jgi:hypothetical protein
MDVIDIDTRAQRLFEDYGPRALVIAAQRARAAASRNDLKEARLWRRIEAARVDMRGALEA